jgi:hypothetical protein
MAGTDGTRQHCRGLFRNELRNDGLQVGKEYTFCLERAVPDSEMLLGLHYDGQVTDLVRDRNNQYTANVAIRYVDKTTKLLSECMHLVVLN